MVKLNERQRRFVNEYLVDGNATQAAIRAGYTKKCAGQVGGRLLNNVEIQVQIKKGSDKVASKIELTVERVLLEMMRIAFADLVGAVDKNGDLLPLDKMPEATRRAISSIEIEDRGSGEQTWRVKKIRFWSKVEALEQLAKRLGLYAPSKVAPTSPDGKTEYQGGWSPELMERFRREVLGLKK